MCQEEAGRSRDSSNLALLDCIIVTSFEIQPVSIRRDNTRKEWRLHDCQARYSLVAPTGSSTRQIIFDWTAGALELGRKLGFLEPCPRRAGRLIWRTFPAGVLARGCARCRDKRNTCSLLPLLSPWMPTPDALASVHSRVRTQEPSYVKRDT